MHRKVYFRDWMCMSGDWVFALTFGVSSRPKHSGLSDRYRPILPKYWVKVHRCLIGAIPYYLCTWYKYIVYWLWPRCRVLRSTASTSAILYTYEYVSANREWVLSAESGKIWPVLEFTGQQLIYPIEKTLSGTKMETVLSTSYLRSCSSLY